jgi:hypothetical protein
MGHKFGDGYVNDMIDRGRRELGGVMFEGSNIAQPMYPLRGSYEPVKQPDGPEPTADGPSLEEKQPAEPSRDDPGREDRDVGLDRE